MKKTFKIFGVLLLILILFKGWIYRHTINYSNIGNRQEIKITNQALLNKIEAQSGSKQIGIHVLAVSLPIIRMNWQIQIELIALAIQLCSILL